MQGFLWSVIKKVPECLIGGRKMFNLGEFTVIYNFIMHKSLNSTITPLLRAEKKFGSSDPSVFCQ